MSATPVFSQTTSMQHLQGDSHAAQTLVLQITMAPVHRHTSQTSFSQHLQCDSKPARTNTMEITMAVTHRTAGGPAATTRAGGPSAVSGHCGESRPSGDHARRRPFYSLWTLRPSAVSGHRTAGGPAATTRAAGPSPPALLQSLDTAERAGPAATTCAAGPSAVSGHCGDSRPSGDHWTLRREPAQRRPRAPQALLQSLDTAERASPAATRRAAGPSAVSGHCRPFCSLWTLRREPAQRRPRAPQTLVQPLWREPAQRRPRAPQALLQSLDTAERAGPAATTRATGPSAVSGHCGESRPSGDHARRRPFCSLWTLRREPAQRRPRAPQTLMQPLDTAERAGPAATTCAAGPSAVSGHCGDSRPSGDHARHRPFCSLWTLRREPAQRRPRAPQALLQSLDTAERAGPPATRRAAGPSAVSGHCRPFCSLWTLRREPAQRRPRAPQTLMQPLDTVERAGPAATTRAAGSSAVSGHCGESRPSGDHARHRPFCSLWTLRREPAQRRPRAPQALLQSLDTAERAGPAATTRAADPHAASGHCGESRPSGDHARRRPFCSLWTLRREPAQRRPRAPQALLQSLDTAERASPAATTRAAGPSAVSSVMESVV